MGGQGGTEDFSTHFVGSGSGQGACGGQLLGRGHGHGRVLPHALHGL